MSKIHIPKPVRHALISSGVLLVLFVSAGVVYTLFMDQGGIKNASSISATTPPTDQPIKAVKPTMTAKEYAAVESITSPVIAGSNAMVIVKTNATSKCTVAVTYQGVASTDSGLAPKMADDYGDVQWSWTVLKTTPVGTWPVSVTCAYQGRLAVVQADLVVTSH